MEHGVGTAKTLDGLKMVVEDRHWDPAMFPEELGKGKRADTLFTGAISSLKTGDKNFRYTLIH